jgi:hypothetical protein
MRRTLSGFLPIQFWGTGLGKIASPSLRTKTLTHVLPLLHVTDEMQQRLSPAHPARVDMAPPLLCRIAEEHFVRTSANLCKTTLWWQSLSENLFIAVHTS